MKLPDTVNGADETPDVYQDGLIAVIVADT